MPGKRSRPHQGTARDDDSHGDFQVKSIDAKELPSLLARLRADLAAAEKSAAAVIAAVRAGGDAALRACTLEFDGAAVDDFRLSRGEIAAARRAFPDRDWRARLERVAGRLARFAEREKPLPFRLEEPEGVIERVYTPVDSAGIYVPAGTAPLVSTVLMTVVPALAAGVKRVAVCTPPGPDGRPNPAVVAAADLLGVGEIYRLGGAQAVAALALGTETIPRVRLVAGPGNEYVAAAKRLLYGTVALDCPAGPSEVLVYAGAAAEPAAVLAELAAQAEHHRGLAFLVTPEASLREAAEKSDLPGYAFAAAGGEALELIEAIAPEHLVLMGREAAALARRVRNAGAVFVGPYSPVAIGDYLAGPSHVLPTGGAAASFAGLSVHTFLRPQARVRWRRAGLEKWSADLSALTALEGLPAHGRSVSARLSGRKGPGA